METKELVHRHQGALTKRVALAVAVFIGWQTVQALGLLGEEKLSPFVMRQSTLDVYQITDALFADFCSGIRYTILEKLVKLNHLQTKINLICILNNQLVPRSKYTPSLL